MARLDARASTPSREISRRGLADYHGKGDHQIETVRYSAAEAAIHINKTQCFRPVPQTVWEFNIGGYQVLDKYLKSRKGRNLGLDEIEHVAKVADSLARWRPSTTPTRPHSKSGDKSE